MSQSLCPQVALWETIPPRVGRPMAHPWGFPRSVWEIARHRLKREGISDRERLAFQASALASEMAAEPWWSSRRCKPVRKAPAPSRIPQVVEREEIAIPAASASASLVRMIKDGQLPGLTWDPARGAIRKIVLRRPT